MLPLILIILYFTFGALSCWIVCANCNKQGTLECKTSCENSNMLRALFVGGVFSFVLVVVLWVLVKAFRK